MDALGLIWGPGPGPRALSPEATAKVQQSPVSKVLKHGGRGPESVILFPPRQWARSFSLCDSKALMFVLGTNRTPQSGRLLTQSDVKRLVAGMHEVVALRPLCRVRSAKCSKRGF